MSRGILSKVAAVHVASTPAEREAVFRFRYSVYIEEMGKAVPSADHERRWVRDAEDDGSNTVIFYTGSATEITGTLRMTTWPAGTASPAFRERFSLDLFPEGVATCEAARLIISRSNRGKLILPALVRTAYEHVVGTFGGTLSFACCAPGLVPIYRRLGYRPYSGDLVCTEDGLRVPLVMITSDEEYFRQVNSPLLDLQRHFFASGRFPPLDTAPFQQLVGAMANMETDPETIWRQMESDLVEEGNGSRLFLDRLPEGALKRLAEKGFLLDVPKGHLVTRESLLEKEVFVILQGVFEVTARQQRLAILHKGEVFGELAFFMDAGRRTASVRAMTEGRLLVLRRRFVEELRHEDPRLAFQIVFNLGRIMAGRLSEMIRPAAAPG